MTESSLPATPAPDQAADVRGLRKGMFHGSSDTSGYGGLRVPVMFPAAAQRPYGSFYDEVVDHLVAAVGDVCVAKVVVDRGELTVFVPREHIVTVCRALRDTPELRFEVCVSVSGVHYPEDLGAELHVVYHLISMTHGSRRIRLEVTAPDAEPTIPSVVGVYPMVDWHERETWDMFGVVFTGRPSLTRILMPDDWVGHPQRKDYPLGGIPVQYKGAVTPPPDQRRSYN